MIIDEYNTLKSAIEFDIIDIDTIQTELEMKKKTEYLKRHCSKIWQSTDNNWYTYMLIDGKKKLVKRKHKSDLEDVIAKHYRDIEEHPTLCQLFDRWVEEKLELGEIKRGTYDKYKNDFKRFFDGKELKTTRIERINEEMLEMFLRKSIIELNLTAKGYAGLRTLIIGIFKYAKRKRYTDLSISYFFKDLQISRKSFKRKPKRDELEVFSEDEVRTITRWLRNHPNVMNYGILFDFYTGMREGELAGLKYSDIQGSTIHIQRQEIRYKSEEKRSNVTEVVEYTKSEAGDRYLIMPPQAIEILSEIRKMNPFGEYIMIKEDGKKIHCDNFNLHLYHACDNCGIPRRSMHKIRKTYATTLLDNGVDDSLIMSQMGHSDIATTRKYYYYSNKSLKRNQEQIFNAFAPKNAPYFNTKSM